MNNFELDGKAKALVDSTTHYTLARKFIELQEALRGATKYIDALEEAVEDCGDVVADTVWDNCPAVEYSHDRAKELLECLE